MNGVELGSIFVDVISSNKAVLGFPFYNRCQKRHTPPCESGGRGDNHTPPKIYNSRYWLSCYYQRDNRHDIEAMLPQRTWICSRIASQDHEIPYETSQARQLWQIKRPKWTYWAHRHHTWLLPHPRGVKCRLFVLTIKEAEIKWFKPLLDKIINF